MGQLVGWLAHLPRGFTLALWPCNGRSITDSLTDAGSSIFTLGFAEPPGPRPPCSSSSPPRPAWSWSRCRSATCRRSTRPSTGGRPRSRCSTRGRVYPAGDPTAGKDVLRPRHRRLDHRHAPRAVPDVGRWAADVAESHTTLPAAGPVPLAAPVLLVGDLAAGGAGFGRADPDPRAGAGAGGGRQALPARRLPVPGTHRTGDGPRCSRGSGPGRRHHPDLRGVPRRDQPDGEVGFPITRDPADAWPEFVGWRVNYERAAYQIACAIDAVPALWSGPRRHATPRSHRYDRQAAASAERQPGAADRRESGP